MKPHGLSSEHSRLRQWWRSFAEQECAGYSPLYTAIARSVATDDQVLGLVAQAPRAGWQPNVLLAAVHYLLLGGDPHPLGQIYAGNADPTPAPVLFRDMVLSRSGQVEQLLSTRRTQTNEPGRAALILPGLAAASKHLGPTIGLIDSGCSAGINLLVDRFHVDYEMEAVSDTEVSPGTPEATGRSESAGPTNSTVQVECVVLGEHRLPLAVPAIAERLGIDQRPVDLACDDQARWLRACVWPDTGRAERMDAAIALAQAHPPAIFNADMVRGIEEAIDRLDPDLPVVVVTTWACAYLDRRQRAGFLDALTRCSRRRPLAWLSAEPPGAVDIVAAPGALNETDGPVGVLGLVTFEGGAPGGRSLAVCHPHGSWIRWTDN